MQRNLPVDAAGLTTAVAALLTKTSSFAATAPPATQWLAWGDRGR